MWALVWSRRCVGRSSARRGASEPHRAFRSEDNAAIVGEFLQRLGLENAVLCGLSYGAGVAWAAAAQGAERVSRIVLLDRKTMPRSSASSFSVWDLRTQFYVGSRMEQALRGPQQRKARSE